MDKIEITSLDTPPRLDRELLAFCHEERKRTPGMSLGTGLNMWTSAKQPAVVWDVSSLTTLDLFVAELLPGYPNRLWWFNEIDDGGSIGSHSHHLNHWAAAYHPGQQELGVGGALCFGDSDIEVGFAGGQIITFPGAVFHHVTPYGGENPRVSLSCNLDFEVSSG